MNKLVFVLLDDIGAAVDFALIIGILIAILAAFFVYTLVKRLKGKRRLLFAFVAGMLVLLVALWAIINGIGYFSGELIRSCLASCAQQSVCKSMAEVLTFSDKSLINYKAKVKLK